MKKSELRHIIREIIKEEEKKTKKGGKKTCIKWCVYGYPLLGQSYCCQWATNHYAENLNQWFKDDWVRIDTQGNIAGKCGTMKKGKKTQRCLPRKKAQSLSKKQRASTSKKKTKSSKQYVSNTKAAGGRKG